MTPVVQVLPPTVKLDQGAHEGPDDGFCVMEAVAFVAGEPHSDHPKCASEVVGTFLRAWNDHLPDDERQQLLGYVPRLVGTAGTPEQERERSFMALDWLIRVQASRWLKDCGFESHAASIESLARICDDETAQKAGAVVREADAAVSAAVSAARSAAVSAARSAAWSAAESAAWSAAWPAARSAAESAAWSAAWSAAESAARSAARSAAVSAAESAAWSAAESAAWSAAQSRLAPTRAALIASAHELVDRMIRVTEDA